jgi:hypothetical protein
MIKIAETWNPTLTPGEMKRETYINFLTDFNRMCESSKYANSEAFDVLSDFYRPERSLPPEMFQFLFRKALNNYAYGLSKLMVQRWLIPMPRDEDVFKKEVVPLLMVGTESEHDGAESFLEMVKSLREIELLRVGVEVGRHTKTQKVL